MADKQVSVLLEGTVEERVHAVLMTLLHDGSILKGHDRYGAILIKGDATDWCVVPRDVMEYLIDRGLITYHRLDS